MPHLELTQHHLLDSAVFALVEARVHWGKGRSSAGWGRDKDPEVASRKAIHEAIERHAYACLPAHARWVAAEALHPWLDPGVQVCHAAWQWADPAIGLQPFKPEEPHWWLRAQPVNPRRPDDSLWVLADTLLSPRAFDTQYRARLVTQANTSGFASAGTLEDAILHAILELIERDALMRHWLAQRPGRNVRLSDLPSSLRKRFAVLQKAGCLVGLQCLDESRHPVWLAWAQHGTLHFTSTGSACALDGTMALESALGELETQALARLEGVPYEPIEATDVKSPRDHAALYATPTWFRRADRLLRPEAPAICGYLEAAAGFTRTPGQLYDALERGGLRPWWIELSPPEARVAFDGRTVHTVRAVVPHLIPISFGYRRQPAGMDVWQCTDVDAVHPYS